MFNIGEYVVYGSAGVCTVEDITTLDLRDVPKEKKYYVLVPLSSKSNRIFVPVGKTKVPMRSIITEEEARKLIRSIPDLEEVVVDNPKMTDVVYKDLLRSCDVIDCARVMKTLKRINQERIASGKKVTAAGERYCRMAEEALYGELAVVLSMDRKMIAEYVQNKSQIPVQT